MRCSIEGCPGEYEQREVVHTVRQGNRIIVIDHVPAEVCTICGDVLFTPETVRKIEFLRHTNATPARTVPLYNFTEAKSA
ncbi:MAG TPA: YgiT-type zinc finger protein [Ktedonobacteraceae bacterium]|nr:YgiT-type zinc finger protein [Ktedonobacteraceae bacterium]